jgi:hypothetical protein
MTYSFSGFYTRSYRPFRILMRDFSMRVSMTLSALYQATYAEYA